jgi:lipoprotein-anchoring transpeptidase ErfK/SrfK
MGMACACLIFSPMPTILAQPRTSIASRIEELERSGQRWIEIRLRSQRLFAWEGDRRVLAVIISSGRAGMETPTGVFAVQSKHRVARMQGANYDVPDVPHVLYYSGNYGIHGTYWHSNFGTPMSHGCINVATDHAKTIFNWASVGTPVVVRP